MSFPLLVSSANYVDGNRFQIELPNTIDLNDYECAIGNCFVYYSWYNISAALNNNTFTLTIPLDTPTTATITLPDGAYNITTLNNYLQYWFITNNYYISNNSTGVYTYYAAFQLSPQSYQIQFITTTLPTSTPSGYTAASGFSGHWPASSNQSMQLNVLSTNTFGSIIGFSTASYPPAATISGTTYTASSNLTPNVNPIYAVQIRLSCLYNQFSSNTTLLHVFTNNDKQIGELIDASPTFYSYTPCIGSHKILTLSFYDENGNVLGLLDPNIMIKLLFRRKKEGY